VIVSALLADPEGSAIVARSRTLSARPNDRSAASNMVAWFSAQITIGTSPWVAFFDRERRAGTWAYRPSIAVHHPMAVDVDMSAVEGEPRMFFHIRRERDPALAKAKRASILATGGQATCEACGFAAHVTYPGLVGDVCEIHHRLPLAEGTHAVVTRLEDLAVLCANCHRAIHKTKPLMTVEAFRSRFLTT
jgi:hypothetical protein